MSFTIGVDVGGTNTDVAIVHGYTVIGWSKSPTTEKIIDGVVHAIRLACDNATHNGHENVLSNIKRVNIGTTHFINAVIKRKDLSKVACIRLCGVASRCLPPFVDFPSDLCDEINGGYFLLNGGFEFNQNSITDIDEKEIFDSIKIITSNGIKHIAVAGIFSPTKRDNEEVVESIIKKNFPEVTYTLSHHLGHLGLIERENAAILNESLKELCEKTIAGFKDAMNHLQLTCPIHFTQNDGTLISEEQTLKFPVYTFSSGATNSMRGAAHLSSLKDAIIVDIGGTSTDVGVLINGFPREASSRVKVGGVNTNFRMPDTKSIGLGGGSIITMNERNKSISVGPSSVEYRITKEALIFGGDTLVSSDIAVASGLADFGDRTKVSHLSEELKENIMKTIKKKVEDAVDNVKLSGEICPVVLVGGGSILIDDSKPFNGASSVIKPGFYQVANAVGAALSQVSGSIDKLISITETNTREKNLQQAKEEAINLAVINGAIKETCNILDISEMQMAYMAVPCMRIRVKAVGDLESIAEPQRKQSSSISTSVESEKYVGSTSSQEKEKSNSPQKEPTTQQMTNNKPTLSPAGEWIISLYDVDCIAIGAGILGCGGGGSPYLGRLLLKRCIENGSKVKVIHPDSMKDNETAYSVAFMGAPEILIERINNGREIGDSINLTKCLLDAGFTSRSSKEDVRNIANKLNVEVKTSEDGKCMSLILPKNHAASNQPSVIIPCEVGGLNAIQPLIAGAELGIPVLDCDGMGRAFPQLQHFSPFINGVPPYPAVITDHHGNHVCCVHCQSPSDLEEFFRNLCISMGCSSGVCIAALTKEEVKTKTCLYTLSEAWYLGNAVLTARQQHTSPIDAILQQMNGKLLCQGKISDMYRETKDGFTWGRIAIQGSGEYLNTSFIVEFQNEFIIAKCVTTGECSATVPDLLTIVDVDTGEPITTDEVRYGLRISLLVLPSHQLMTTKKALNFVGPQAFKYKDLEYKPICMFSPVKPIPKCYV